MIPTRSNLARPPVDPSLDLTEEELASGLDAYKNWHWGKQAVKVIDCNDNDKPRALVQCGNLIRFHIRTPQTMTNPSTHPRRSRDPQIQLSRTLSANSHLAYDPNHPDQRLYCILDPRVMQFNRANFWNNNTAPEINLNDLAMAIGSRHGKRRDYPNVMVKPVGAVTAVVYFTDKEGDGPSYYIHKMAEISGGFPALAVDEKGRFWFAGGSYTTPNPGITD